MTIVGRAIPSRPLRPIGLALAIVLVAPASTAAQTVVGRIVDQENLEPLAAAFVGLETPDGQRQSGVLTKPDGRFSLRASSPGRYRLIVQMIGYDSPPAEYVDLEAGATVERDMAVPVQAITLAGIQVTSRARCRPRPGDGPDTALLWEEARKALEVASWSESAAVVRFRGVRHERMLDPGTLRVTENDETGWTGWYGRSPYASLPAEQLARHGFVVEQPDGALIYYAPDADVLLSDMFLDSHCFHVASGPPGEPELIGLGFEPIQRRALPEIKGVLWLDRSTAELRRLDFSYVNVPGLPASLWDVATGRVEFDHLPSGVWIVRRWRIQMPAAAVRSDPSGRFGSREVVLLGIRETGSEVRHVIHRDGSSSP